MSKLTSDILDRDVFCEHMDSTSDHSRRLIFLHDSALRHQLATAQARIEALEQEKLTMYEEAEHAATEALARLQRLEQQLVTTHAHLEAQRTATYQAVEREHAAKRELAISRHELHVAQEVIVAISLQEKKAQL